MNAQAVTIHHAALRQELLALYRQFVTRLNRARTQASAGEGCAPLRELVGRARDDLTLCHTRYEIVHKNLGCAPSLESTPAYDRMDAFLRAYAAEIADGDTDLRGLECRVMTCANAG